MNYWLDIRLKISRFFRKHKKKIIIILVVWAVVIAINYYLKYMPKNYVPKTTYEPHSPVIDKTDKVPESYKEPISNLINDFVENCNNKNYEAAFDLLSNEYKERYKISLEDFKQYVDNTFPNKKLYNIQNYSNLNNTYVYNVRLLDDILEDGTTDGYDYSEYKFVVRKEGDVLKLSLNGYCGYKDLGINVADDYMEIEIQRVYITYTETSYVLKISNKTNNYIVLTDRDNEVTSILLKLPKENRAANYLLDSNIVIHPNETKELELQFNEFFDDGQEPTKLILNSIKILPEYTGIEENFEKEMENAVKLYSLAIDLIPSER